MVEGESSSGMHKLFACVVNISIRSSAHLKKLFCQFGCRKKRTRTKKSLFSIAPPQFLRGQKTKNGLNVQKSLQKCLLCRLTNYICCGSILSLVHASVHITLEHSPDVAPGERRGRGGGTMGLTHFSKR